MIDWDREGAGKLALLVTFLALLGLLVLGLCKCGPRWADSDSRSAADAVRLEAAGLDLCSPGGDACAPSQVRALERAALCANASMLYRHGDDVPDAGVACLAR